MRSFKLGRCSTALALVLAVVGCSESDEPPPTPSVSVPTSTTAAVRPPTTALPFYDDAAFTPRWLASDAAELETFHHIPPFSLTNQDGEAVTEHTFAGKIYVADFFFTTCPGICARMTRNMHALQEELADSDDVLFLSHSVTPDIDDVARLKQYAVTNGVRSGRWHLVTGDRDVIYQLGRKAYFVEEDQGLDAADSEFLHTENFVLIDRRGHIRGIYNGLNKASLRQLVEDIRYLQQPKLATEQSPR